MKTTTLTAFLIYTVALIAGLVIGTLSITIRAFGAYGYSPRIEDGIWFLVLAIAINLYARWRP